MCFCPHFDPHSRLTFCVPSFFSAPQPALHLYCLSRGRSLSEERRKMKRRKMACGAQRAWRAVMAPRCCRPCVSSPAPGVHSSHHHCQPPAHAVPNHLPTDCVSWQLYCQGVRSGPAWGVSVCKTRPPWRPENGILTGKAGGGAC